MDPSHTETGSELRLHLRKCVLCEKLITRAQETFLEHISEEHNLRSMGEYDAYYDTYCTLNGKSEEEKESEASVKQDKVMQKRCSGGGVIESEKVDSGVEDADSDQELASWLHKQPGLVQSSDAPADSSVMNERPQETTTLPTWNDTKSMVKLDKEDEG